MKRNIGRFDAPFWVVLLAGLFLVGSLGCFGLAAAAQGAAETRPSVLMVDDS